jgi:hypothetical protein
MRLTTGGGWLTTLVNLFRRTPEEDALLRQLRERRHTPNPDTIAFLERLQAAAPGRPTPRPAMYNTPESIRSIFPNASDEDVAGLRGFLTEMESLIRPPTKYEGVEHVAVQARAAQLDEAVARHGRWSAPVAQPLFALMNIGHVNARTIRAPNTGDCIVLVDEELLQFLYLFSDSMALALPVRRHRPGEGVVFSTSSAEIRTHLQQDTQALMRFVELVLSYAMTGRASHARPHALPTAGQGLASRLDQAAETFVFAHEYVHVLEGHLSDGRRDVTGFDGEQVSQSLWSLTLEGLADLFGLDLTVKVLANSGDALFAYWGAELFLYANEILLKAISTLRSGHEIDGLRPHEKHQHATFNARWTMLEFMARDQLRNTTHDEAEFERRWAAASQGLHAIRDTMTELWRLTAPLLQISHARGARPSSVWDG